MSEAPRPVTITTPVTLTVNGVEVTAQKGELLIDAAERNGAYIPRFCYHPRMTPVGMCRMCLVEVDTGRGPALQPSCMIECADGMAVDTKSENVQKAQDGVLEFLLINHPLDCPVCDKGGECPLQDQTMAYGPGESRFIEEKRHYQKPLPISETVYLDRERCILCDRCTRFADEVAGDPLIHFMGRGAATQVNTFPGEPFSSYFSGNTVQICPVGALTAKPYRFKARPWDLEQVESTCTGCSVGCRVAVQSSHDRVIRLQGVDIDPVNWSWLCDKGRFGFEALNDPGRLTEPLVRSGGELVSARWNDALTAAAAAIRQVATTGRGPGGVAVLGGARLTNEAAYAWARLAKGVIGTDHVDAQLGDGLPADVVLGLPRTTIDGACATGGVVLVVGGDPKEELGVLYLRLKHAAERDGVRIVEVTPARTGLSRYAHATVTYRPGQAAQVIAALLAGDSSDAADSAQFERAATALASDAPLSVLLGRASVAEAASSIVDAAGVVSAAKPSARFLSLLRRGNVHGALDMGLAPGLLPGRVRRSDGAPWFEAAWGGVPAEDGLDAAGVLTAAAEGRIDTLILLGADPIADFPDRRLAERAITGARTVIAVDTLLNESSRRADIVLPAAAFGEVDGTTTNLEGRVSVLAQKVNAPGTARPDWLIAVELAERLGGDLGASSVTDLIEQIAELSAVHAGLTVELLQESHDGIVLPLPVDEPGPERPEPLVVSFPATTSMPAVDAYGFALVARRTMYDQGTQIQACASSAALSQPMAARLHPLDAETLGVVDGGRVALTNGDRSTTAPVVTDAGVPRSSVVLPLGATDGSATALIDAAAIVNEIRIEVR